VSSPALAEVNLGFHLTPNGLRLVHVSWLLAGGADLQVVKERLECSSITTTEGACEGFPMPTELRLPPSTPSATQSTGQPPWEPKRMPNSSSLGARWKS
jgi:hypothetical protein